MIDPHYNPPSDYRWEPHPLYRRPMNGTTPDAVVDDSSGKLLLLAVLAIAGYLYWTSKREKKRRVDRWMKAPHTLSLPRRR